MALSPNARSTLTFSGGQNKTSTAISTNIIIAVLSPGAAGGYTPVGAVQNMHITESRSIKMIDEVGTDGHIDSVPNQSTNIKGTCQRVRFDAMRIAEAFSRGFLHVHSQAYPFDIVIFDQQQLAAGSQITTIIKNVWISDIDYTYQSNDWVITDNMSWEAETIFSMLNASGNTLTGGGAPASTGGANNIPLSIIPVEQQSDTGSMGSRGSLDAPGLIDLGSSGSLF